MSERESQTPALAAPATPLVYTVREVMSVLQLSRNSVHTLLRTGELSSLRLGRKWLVPRSAVQDYLRRQAGPSSA